MHFHRDMLAICDSYAKHVLQRRADRPLHRLAAARLHLRAWRPRAVSAPHRRVHRAAGEGRAGRTARRNREIQDHHPVHRADRLSRHARQAQGLRHLVAPQMRVGRRDAAEGDLRRLARRDRHQDPRRHRRDRNAAHLHRLAGARGARRLDRKAGAGLRGPHPRRRRQRSSARHGRPPCGARADRLPLSRRRAGRRNTCRTAGTSPATPT